MAESARFINVYFLVLTCVARVTSRRRPDRQGATRRFWPPHPTSETHAHHV